MSLRARVCFRPAPFSYLTLYCLIVNKSSGPKRRTHHIQQRQGYPEPTAPHFQSNNLDQPSAYKSFHATFLMCLWYMRMGSIYNGTQGHPGGDESFANGQYCIYTERSGSADMNFSEVVSTPFRGRKSLFGVKHQEKGVGWPPRLGPWSWSEEEGLPDRRNLGAKEGVRFRS